MREDTDNRSVQILRAIFRPLPLRHQPLGSGHAIHPLWHHDDNVIITVLVLKSGGPAEICGGCKEEMITARGTCRAKEEGGADDVKLEEVAGEVAW